MTLHNDIIGGDVAEVLMDVHGESVRFRSSSVDARTITAIVHRQPRREASPGGPSPGRVVPRMTVSVYPNSTTGIAPTEVDDDGAEIEVASLQGGSKRWRRINRNAPAEQSGGLLNVEVTA